MRVVLDTNIRARAGYRVNGPARAVLDLLGTPPHVLITSPFILGELERVLNYPRMQRHHGLDAGQVRAFVERVERAAELVDLGGPQVTVSQDPDDNPILQTAVIGRAEGLCTLDRHFAQPDVQAYCASHGMRLLTDVQLLQMLHSLGSQGPMP